MSQTILPFQMGKVEDPTTRSFAIEFVRKSNTQFSLLWKKEVAKNIKDQEGVKMGFMLFYKDIQLLANLDVEKVKARLYFGNIQ